MRVMWIVVLALQVAGTAAAGSNAKLVQQVKDSETAFAKTMADRNLDAFKEFVSEEALFFHGKRVLRGRAAIVEGWKSLYDGPKPPFSWGPDQVEVLDSGTLALSTGPVLDPAGKVVGRFNSIWRLENGDHWRVIFDKGCPVCTDK